MRQSTLRLRPPGVYREQTEKRFVPLTLSRSGVPGFVGITRKGPTNVPLRITSFEQFRDVYGRLDLDTYLAPAVEGFFLNGGRDCYVIRVAHLQDKGGRNIATRATTYLRNANGTRAYRVEALSEGTWGNGITVQARQMRPRVQTFITLDAQPGDQGVFIKSTHGFAKGTVVKIYDDSKHAYRVVSEIDGKALIWGEDGALEHSFNSGSPTYIEPVEFEIEVRGDGHREIHRELSVARTSMSYVERVINTQSRLIQVVPIDPMAPLEARFLDNTQEEALVGGADGIFSLGPEDFIGRDDGPEYRTGLKVMETVDSIDLLLCPDLMWCLGNADGFRTEKHVEVVQDEMIAQAERQRDRFVILDFPGGKDHLQALSWRQVFDSQFAAFYFPWVCVEHDGKARQVPPSGHIAGVIARVDNIHGVHHPPGNEEIEGVIDLDRVLQEEDIGYLTNKGINCLKYFPSRGIRVWGARTVSSDPSLRYLNVRRVVSAIIRSMQSNLQWVVFEPNYPKLWKTLERNVSYFLQDLWKKGFFAGRSPDDAFYVKCDHETNPAEMRSAGILVVEVGVAPVRPAEYIVFRVQQEVEEVGPGAGSIDTGEL